ncbi:MAG: zf-HC2 domain-containing protein [Oscillospiraceae bacterium]|nr:zf-HC2 domain-containing protein [Oscillospiraceae bacterium]
MNCCKEYAQTISEYLDGALGENERAQLLEHLESCEGCRAYLAELAAMHDALAETGEVELPAGFHESVMAKVHAKARAKKLSVWKRYAAVAACAAIVFAGALRLMPDFGAKSAAPEAAAGGADMAMQVAESAAEAPAAAEEGGARALEDKKEYGYMAETELFADAALTKEAEAAEAGEEIALPVIRGENARETLLSLGATEDGELLLVPVEALENLPEGLTLEGEFDASGDLIPVLVEEVAK